MAAAKAAAFSFFSSHSPSPSPSTSPSYFRPFHPIQLRISNSIPNLPVKLKFPFYALPLFSNQSFQAFSAVEDVTLIEDEAEKTQKTDQRRKLFVLNLPWSFSVTDIKNLFGECGTVTDVEIIKQKDGKNKGFAFVTMSSGEEAQAAIDKFDSFELLGRILRVEFAKRLKKPSPPPPAVIPPPRETRHNLYVSNLPWKVRSNHLREFFSANYNPVSARVVFDSPSGKAAGYGFVSFGTREEAEAAISSLDGKELMGRPIRLKFSERNSEEAEQKEDARTAEGDS